MDMGYSTRLQRRFMWWFFSLSIIPVVMLTGYFTWSQSQLLINQAHQQLEHERDRNYATITSYFDDQVRAVINLAASDLATSSGGRFYGFPHAFQQLGNNTRQAQRRLIPILQQSSSQHAGVTAQKYRRLYRRFHHQFQAWLARYAFNNLAMFDLNQNLVYAVKPHPMTQDNPSLKRAIKQLMSLPDQQRPKWVRTAFEPHGSRTMQAWYLVPILKSGQMQSILAIRTTTDNLSATLRQRQRPESGLWLINQNHQSLLNSWVPHTDQATPSILPPKHAINAAFDGQQGVMSPSQYAIMPQLTAYLPVNVAGASWALITCTPQKSAYRPLRHLYAISATLVIVVIVLLVFIGHWLSHRLTLPILQLTWCAEQFAAGELDYPVTHRQRNDEIGRLASALSHLKHSMRARYFAPSSTIKHKETHVHQSEGIHRRLVNAMNLALAAWDGDKVDLAEKSGLWRVYQDKGSFQTRTLDKYLHVETVPKTPRWRNVVRTLDFVLKHTSEQSPHYQSLKQAQSDIQNWVSQDKGRR
ncbi:HAMP domain-containing protein [Salinivibrio kushneri]|uniref:HAMP domain-containing protein n=1 Tax=Salinivibrio kushneri TaxID=1908198 RepID=UPI000C82FF6F|nr:HAMP domain-containing protein [Salinivibrio kushneri]